MPFPERAQGSSYSSGQGLQRAAMAPQPSRGRCAHSEQDEPGRGVLVRTEAELSTSTDANGAVLWLFLESKCSLKCKKKVFKEKDKKRDPKPIERKRKFQKGYSQEISIQGGPLDAE